MAASTTVRLSAAAKRRLDQLQARLVLLSGRSLTKEEVLDRLVAHGVRHPGHILADEWRPPSPEERHAIMDLPVTTGRRTREEDIDRDLYGG